MRRVEFLTVLWLAGLVAAFVYTTVRQRENLLLLAWIALALPCVYWAVRLVL